MTAKQKNMLKRIIVAAVLFLALFVVEHLELIPLIETFPIGIIVFLVPYVIVGWDIVYKAVRNISRGQVFDENFLMFVATVGAFVVGEYLEAVAVMLFYQIGELFQNYAVNRSRQSITELMDICPEYANVEQDGELVQVDPDDVEVGTVIVVKAGERVPLDGVIIEGDSMVDTSSLTGESVPRHVTKGSEIISGCVNGSGVLYVKTTKEFDDSTVAKILELVENASSKKAKVENFITRFARYYTPFVVCGAALLAVIPPLLFGADWFDCVQRACIFLVISCPCALVISVPLSFFGGIGAASKAGILVKGSNFLEVAAELETVVFDKTGTLTKGEFSIVDIIPANNFTRQQLLETAAYAEYYSNHPVAVPVKEAFLADNGVINAEAIADSEEISGHGIKVSINGEIVLAGNEKLLLAENVEVKDTSFGSVSEENESANKGGINKGGINKGGINKGSIKNAAGTVIYVAKNGKYMGCIVIADTVKAEAKEALALLKSAGVKKTVMLTGDRKAAGEAVAKELGIDEVHTQLLPADKVRIVEELLSKQSKGKVAFVGDGINDAPVLTRADVGFAMGSMGSDAAIEAADIVLMDDDTSKIAKVVKISRKTLKIVKQNIVFALGVKALVLVLGALGMANMWGAVFADVGVSVIAILNAMRVLRTK